LKNYYPVVLAEPGKNTVLFGENSALIYQDHITNQVSGIFGTNGTSLGWNRLKTDERIYPGLRLPLEFKLVTLINVLLK